MKIGDKVRFLSEVGGGRVSGFQGKDIVVIGEEDYDTRHVVEVKQRQKAQTAAPQKMEEEELEPADRPITFRPKPEERKGGDKLSAYLAFVPLNVKELMQTRFESYLVNDSNYYLRYALLSAEGTAYSVRATGEVEPNTKAFIEEFGREDLQGLEHVCIQMIAYKRD